MSQPVVNFNVQCFIQAAEELLRSDETLRALNLLDNLPGYYRDNPPPEISLLKREIQARIATSSFYAQASDYELTAPADSHLTMNQTVRGHLLLKDIQALNKQDLLPNVADLGPGEYWTPKMLMHNKALFTYNPIWVNHPAFNHHKKDIQEYISEQDDNRPTIFFAGEVLEHLHYESDLRCEMERYVGLADIIHVSTPLYTFNYNCQNWREIGDLGHLRTYTPNEFNMTMIKLFPEYEVTIYVTPILHCRAVLQSTKYNIEKRMSL